MNVIIRLQNLPWSANASDIRQFFRGLQIPEGGVHIVGGEDGDAFIAFSTDEDARQAMSMNKMKLKETQVTLLLSSRAEMQKVIEKARAAAGFHLTKAAQSSLPTPEAFTNQFATKKILENVVKQQPVIATNYMQVQQQQTVLQSSNYQIASNGGIPGLGGAINPNANLPMYFNPVDYLKLVNQQPPPQINIPTNTDPRTRDPRDPRDQSRFKASPVRERNRERSRSPYSSDEKRDRRRKTRFSSPDKNTSQPAISTVNAAVTQPHLALIQQQQQLMQQQVAYSTNQQLLATQQRQVQNLAAFTTNQAQLPIVNKQSLPNSGIWDIPPALNLNSYSSFNGSANQVQQTRNYQTISESNNYQTSSYSTSSSSHSNQSSSIGTCVKISNVDKDTTYGDIRKFFGGLPIGNNDIKFITDGQGNSTGVALVRFVSSDSKKQALTKNGWQLKTTQIMITSITEDDFENGLENVIKSRYENKRTYDDPKRDRLRDRERSDSREKDRDYGRDRHRNDRDRGFGNRDYNNRRDNFNNRGSYGGGNNYRNNNYRRDDDKNDFERNDRRNFNNNRDRSIQNDNPQDQEAPTKIAYTPDENFQVLIIDDIPRANEAEIFEAFPTVVDLTIERYTAYCKFNSHDDAKALLENRYSHFIKEKRVFVEKGSEAQFNDLAKKYGMRKNPSLKSGSSENGEQSSNEDKPISRDPRQRSSQPQNGDSYRNNLKTDCIIIKRMNRSATIEDVEQFLSDLNIQRNQIRIHILLDKRGQPSGDCFVEFQFENDVQKALTKNNMYIGQNRVEVLPIPREQVNAVLNSFGPGGPPNDDRPQANFNQQNRRDWGPPPDFGSPNCVVMISNLSYRASIEEILEAFREFDLQPDQVIRRFNDNGQPTGMACINFNSPEDATKACDQYNKTLVSNRPIWLRRA